MLDAKKAAAIYNRIVASMKDPALLEYTGSQMFRVRVFPIEARSEKKIRLSYRQILERDEHLTSYRYPLRAARFAAGNLGRISVQVTLDADGAGVRPYSPSHPFQIQYGDHRYSMNWQARNHKPERDISILIPHGKELAFAALTHAGPDGRYFWLSLSPPVKQHRALPKDLAIVIDTSGSMAGKKLAMAQAALRFCVENLEKEDRFQIIAFSTEARAAVDGWTAADGAGKRRANAFIDELRPIGGTNMEDALRLVDQLPRKAGRPQMVLFLTDGKPTIGNTDENHLIQSFSGGFRLFSMGIGDDINTHLLDRLAMTHGGWRTYATPDEDIELQLTSLFTKIKSPTLVDPVLSFKGVKVSQQHPHRLADMFQGLPQHVLGRYQGSGPVTVTLEGTVNGKRQRYTWKTRFAKREKQHAFIPKLWAQRRVGYLLDQIRLEGESKEVIDEVVELARTHGILTPYTSWLILEDERVADRPRPWPRPTWPTRREAPRAEQEYRAMQQKSGRASVRASKVIQDLSESDEVATPAAAAERGQQQISQVAGRAFYQTHEGWLDAYLPASESAPAVELAFAGEDYFNLLARFPELAPILALGQKVRFVHQGRVYQTM